MVGPITRSRAKEIARQFEYAKACEPMKQVLRTSELLTMIFKFLPKEALQATVLVNKKWRDCTIKAAESSCVSKNGDLQTFLIRLSQKLENYPYQKRKILAFTQDEEKVKFRSLSNLLQIKSKRLEVENKVAIILGSLQDQALIDVALAGLCLPEFFQELPQHAKAWCETIRNLNQQIEGDFIDYYQVKDFCTLHNLSLIWFSVIKQSIELGFTGLGSSLMRDGGDCNLEKEELEAIAELIYQIEESDYEEIRMDYLHINNVEFSRVIARKMSQLAIQEGDALECFKIAYRYLKKPRETLFVEELQECREIVENLFKEFSKGVDTHLWLEEILKEVLQDDSLERLLELLNLGFFVLTDADVVIITKALCAKFPDLSRRETLIKKSFLDQLTNEDQKKRFIVAKNSLSKMD